jgi:hypothetical protein
MAHYAKVNNGIVEQVIVAEAEFFDTFVDSSPGEWVQTSYNTYGNVHANGETPLRKNYAGIGSLYDGTGFYSPQPYASWTKNEDTYLWEAPTVYPDDGKYYQWNEGTTSWDEVEAPE